MLVFWKKGFKETSLSDLTRATGLHKGSLYSAFESKENLFHLSLKKYGEISRKMFIDPKTRTQNPLDYIELFLKTLVIEGSRSDDYKACLILNSCVELGMSTSKAAKFTRDFFAEIEKNFQTAVNLAVKGGLLKKTPGLSARLVAAAFSIREISKFKRDETFLKQIANGVLKEIGRKL